MQFIHNFDGPWKLFMMIGSPRALMAFWHLHCMLWKKPVKVALWIPFPFFHESISELLECLSSMSHTIGFRSGLFAGQSITWILSLVRTPLVMAAVCALALSCVRINPGPIPYAAGTMLLWCPWCTHRQLSSQEGQWDPLGYQCWCHPTLT